MSIQRGSVATKRSPVALPSLVTEALAAGYPVFEMERSKMADGRLVFDRNEGFARAISQGFFLVEIPSGVDTTGGDSFARHFFEPKVGDLLDRYRGFRDVKVRGDYQGYFDREHDQWENFYIEMANWEDILPPEVARLGHQMTDLGIAILRSVLEFIDVPARDWALVTGGLTERQGHQMLAFNHFRTEKPVRGSKFHRDSGWVTVLRSTESGLIALIEGRLWRVNPQPGYFIANFGSSIEVLTNELPRPVRASIHGVARMEPVEGRQDRTSYVTFLDSNLSGMIHRYRDGRPVPVQTMAEFAVQEVSRTYNDDSETL